MSTRETSNKSSSRLNEGRPLLGDGRLSRLWCVPCAVPSTKNPLPAIPAYDNDEECAHDRDADPSRLFTSLWAHRS